MDRLCAMKDRLVSLAETQLNGNIENVDAKELGEVMDMIKDLSETMVNCQIYKSMEDASEEEKEMRIGQYMPQYKAQRYYTRPWVDEMYPRNDYKDMERWRDMDVNTRKRMYYTDPMNGQSTNTTTTVQRDVREGRSGITRRTFMEMKDNNVDKNERAKEMEEYMRDLSDDITEMIMGLDPNEKATAKQRITTLANKIV